MSSVSQKLQSARTCLLLEQPFWGVLALRLRMVEDNGCGTAWTNGTHLGYDPAFIEKLAHDELVGLMAHEVGHCVLGHPWRGIGREHRKWNEAADYSLNGILLEANFKLPAGGLMPDATQAGKSAEWIYDRLPDQPKGGGGGGMAPGETRNAPGAGDDKDAEGRDQQTEADWKAAVSQAAKAAKAQGKLPASLERFAGEASKSCVDWRSTLRRFIQDAAKNDYTWQRPSRRYLSAGLYMPSLYSEEMGPILVCVDTSGSIDNVTLSQFFGEINGIQQEASPRRVSVVYCDAAVQRHDVFEKGDLIEMHPKGGGGTAFEPALLEAVNMEDRPVCAVYLTDLCGPLNFEAPDFPVLWVSTHDGSPGFGEVIRIGS